ncbi:hypothetical protein ACFL2A_05955 [Thermodesulfobacteriota bacterium]
MELPKEAIEEFREITKSVFNKDLSYDESKELALNFMEFCKVIFRPLPSQLNNKNQHGEGKEKL